MAHHSTADLAKPLAWSEHGVVTTRRYSPVVRFGTVVFWSLIAGLLVARLLVPDPNKTEATASAPHAQTATPMK